MGTSDAVLDTLAMGWRRYMYVHSAEPYLGNIVGEWFRKITHRAGIEVRARASISLITR